MFKRALSPKELGFLESILLSLVSTYSRQTFLKIFEKNLNVVIKCSNYFGFFLKSGYFRGLKGIKSGGSYVTRTHDHSVMSGGL